MVCCDVLSSLLRSGRVVDGWCGVALGAAGGRPTASRRPAEFWRPNRLRFSLTNSDASSCSPFFCIKYELQQQDVRERVSVDNIECFGG